MYDTLDDTKEAKTILLKGAPGSGKTYKAAHFPRPVFFNFDQNLSGLKKLPKETRDGIKVVNPAIRVNPKDPSKNVTLKTPQVWDNFISLLGKVAADPDVDTIVIDSLTTLQEVLMDKVVNSDSPTVQMTQQNWGTLGRYWKALASTLLTAPDLDKNVIFIAHEKPYEDNSTGVKMIMQGLNLGGSMKDGFDLYFSDVWRCFVKPTNKEPEYWVASTPSRTFNAKKSLDIPASFKWDSELTNILKQL